MIIFYCSQIYDLARGQYGLSVLHMASATVGQLWLEDLGGSLLQLASWCWASPQEVWTSHSMVAGFQEVTSKENQVAVVLTFKA